jgi:hypothetical protein
MPGKPPSGTATQPKQSFPRIMRMMAAAVLNILIIKLLPYGAWRSLKLAEELSRALAEDADV